MYESRTETQDLQAEVKNAQTVLVLFSFLVNRQAPKMTTFFSGFSSEELALNILVPLTYQTPQQEIHIIIHENK